MAPTRTAACATVPPRRRRPDPAMTYPPRSRRTRVRRRIAFALASLAVMAVVCGFAFLPGDGFPAARSERLAGTPVTLRLQDDVKTADVRAIRTGIRLADRYMRRHLGRAVREPVEARVAGSAGCDLLRVSDGIPVGQAERGRLCIDTGSLGWQWLLLKDRTAAAAIAAHEYVHDLQAELGCLPGGRSERPRWL